MDILQKRLLTQKKSSSLLPREYQQVEYIEGTGTQYIDTNHTRTKVVGFDLSFTPTTTETYYVFGSDNNNSDYRSRIVLQKYTGSTVIWYFDSSYGYNLSASVVSSSGWNSVSWAGGEYSIRNNVIGTYTSLGRTNNYSIVLFGENIAGTITASPLKLSYFKLYSGSDVANGTLVRDFIPCYRKSDEVIGMYDLCGSVCPLTNTPFYINAGTGKFLKGDDVF